MQIAGFVVSLVAIGIALVSIRFALREDKRADREERREERRVRREEEEAAVRKSREKEDRETRRVQRRGSLEAVAAELREASEIAFRCETAHVPSETEKLRIEEWPKHRDDLAWIRDVDLLTWNDLNNAYEQLARAKRDGAYPPPNGWLSQLAGRVVGLSD